MKWASSVGASARLSDCIAQAAAAVRLRLKAATADLALVFASHHFRDAFDHLPALVQEHLPSRVLVGCSAAGVIGGGEEVEHEPAVSLTAALLPGVQVRSLYSDTLDLPDPDAPPAVWRAWLGLRQVPDAQFIVLADPFTAALEPFLTGLDYAYPDAAKIGGLASGGRQKGDHALFQDDRVHRHGLLAVALSGNLEVETIVAQGCRPIGKPLVVTRCEHNLLLEVDRLAPLKYLAGLVEEMGDHDRQLMRTSLFLGVEMDPLREGPAPGDFLIRNLVGIDYGRGILAAGTPLQEGQVVQFHLRDKVASAGDLDGRLERARERARARPPAGALLFSCLGRGRHLYGEVNHDSRRFAEELGAVPLGGFFCNGEIGPVAQSTHLHGYTSSFGLFREKGGGREAGDA
jgi:small ligand-binding sensory domain FIST